MYKVQGRLGLVLWEDYYGVEGMMEIYFGKVDWEQILEGVKVSLVYLDFIF